MAYEPLDPKKSISKPSKASKLAKKLRRAQPSNPNADQSAVIDGKTIDDVVKHLQGE